MKKKLSKEELKERKEKLNKFLRITLYISLAFNVLFSALIIYSCAAQPKSSCAAQPIKQLRQERNYKVTDFDVLSNSSLVSYDLTNIELDDNRSSIITASVSNYFSTKDNIVLFTGSMNALTEVNEINLDVYVDNPVVSTNHIYIRALHRNADNSTTNIATRLFYFSSSWSSSDGGGQYNTDNGFYIAFNYALSNQNGFGLIGILEGLFPSIAYRDLQLPSNWNIYEKLPLTTAMSINDSPVIVNLAHDIIFGVGGRLYNTIRAVYGYNTKVYYNDSSTPLNLETGYLEMIQYFNSSTNDTLVVYLYQSKITDNGSGIDYGNYRLLDANFLNVRLFGINLIQPNNVNVMDIFNFSSNYYNDISSTGQFGDVFGLIGTAFSGAKDLLSITILPGITIGVLFMLPVVAFIVFAIIRVVKK